MCGFYAIANAYGFCGYNKSSCKELFHVAYGVLAKRRWPHVPEDGTSFGDMRKMLSACQSHIRERFNEPVDIRYPFLRNIPKSDVDYWQQLNEIFADGRVHCCIVGREKPSQHWIVAYPHSERRVQFLDSTPGRSSFRKNRTQIHAGPRRQHKSQWRIHRQELIVFIKH